MKPILAFTLILLILAACFPPAPAQVAAEANKEYNTPEDRKGIVKRLEDPDRQKRLQIGELIALLGIRPGHTVADIGAGTGILLPHLVEAVGFEGRVIAEDIQQDFLDRAQARIQASKWTNVSLVLGTDKNPNLPAAQIDLAVTLDAYHHFDYPAEMLGHIARALKPEGRFAIVDFYQRRRGSQDKDMSRHVRADRDAVIREVEANGFQLQSRQDHGSNQYILIFRKK